MNIEDYKHLCTPIIGEYVNKNKYLLFRENTPSTKGFYFVSISCIQLDGADYYDDDGRIVTHVLDLSKLTTKDRAIEFNKWVFENYTRYEDENPNYLYFYKKRYGKIEGGCYSTEELFDKFIEQNKGSL